MNRTTFVKRLGAAVTLALLFTSRTTATDFTIFAPGQETAATTACKLKVEY